MAELKETLKEDMLSFAETTTLNGLFWVVVAKRSVEKIFYVILILIGLGLTIKDVTLLTQQYLSEEKKTTTTFVVREGFTVPLTICVDIDTASMKVPIEQTNKTVAQLLSQLEYESITAIFDKLLHTNPTDWLADQMSLVSLTAQMLANIVRVENYGGSPYYKFEPPAALNIFGISKFVLRNGSKQRAIVDGTQLKLLEINQFYAKKHMPFDKLLQLVGATLCKWMQLSFTAISPEFVTLNDRIGDVCKPKFITWLGAGPKGYRWELFCLKPELGAIHFSKELLKVDIRFYHKNLFKPELLTSGGYYVNGGTSGSYLLYSGQRVESKPINPNSDAADLLRYSMGEVKLVAVNKAISTKADPCSPVVSYMDCWLGCRAKFIAKHCHCWPLSGFDLPNREKGIPLCGSEIASNNSTTIISRIRTDPDNCGLITSDPDVGVSCSNACLYKCDQMIINLNTQPQGNADPTLTNETFIGLYADPSTYPLFEQSLSMSGTDFLNQLGGALSLYLGCSLIGVIHLLVFPTNLFLEWFASKRKPKSSPQQRPNDVCLNV